MAKNRKPKPSRNPHKGAGGKTPRAEHNIEIQKVPRTQSGADQPVGDRKIRFAFGDADLDGPWSLRTMHPDHISGFFEFLRNIETKTVSELQGTSDLYKEYDNFAECPNAAAPRRLAELYSSADNICRLRITGKRRLYGLRFDHLIALLWWDPEHEIWPSPKKNT